MTEYRLVSEPRADLDIEAAFHWYENEQPGLGLAFLDELRAPTIALSTVRWGTKSSGLGSAGGW